MKNVPSTIETKKSRTIFNSLMKYIHYKTLENQQIILSYGFGLIGYEDLLACKARLVSEKESNPAMKLLVDLRDAEIVINQEHVEAILSERNRDSNVLDGNDIALLISTPMAAIASLIFINNSQGLYYFDLVFSTLPEALNHLKMVSANKDHIREEINKIRQETP